MSAPWDAVVIGLGGVGSFALRALSQKSSKILGIEQFRRCHEQGSSHGSTRIYRRAYFEHPSYVPWIEYSLKEFRALEESQGVDIIHECGTLVMEEENGGGNVIERCNKAATQHKIPVETLSNSQLRERFPQFEITPDTIGLFEPEGGFLRPEIAMKAALKEAECCGATIWEETTIRSVREVEKEGVPLVEVVVEKDGEEQVVTAKSVVISAGGWTSQLIPSWRSTLKTTRQVQGWVDVSTSPDPTLYDPSNMPTWYLCTPNHPFPLYGTPADPKSDHPLWIKVGIHKREVQVNPNEAAPTLDDEEWSELRHAGRHSIQHANDMGFACAKPCLYTMSPDENFIIGPPAGTKQIYAVAGLSGHGFKMAPALGQMMAEWALQQDTSHWNADFVPPARFGI